MKKYEYKTVAIGIATGPMVNIDTEKLDQALATFGEKGWELVNILPVSADGCTYEAIAVFKREIIE